MFDFNWSPLSILSLLIHYLYYLAMLSSSSSSFFWKSCLGIPCGWLKCSLEFHPCLYCVSIFIDFRFCFFNNLENTLSYWEIISSLYAVLLRNFIATITPLYFVSYEPSIGFSPHLLVVNFIPWLHISPWNFPTT